MTPKVRKRLNESKALEAPSLVLTVVLIYCIWIESLKLGAAVLVLLLILISVRYTCVIARRVRFLKVKYRNADNLFNRIGK